MTIAFDAVSQGDVLTDTSLTVAHTCAGSDRLLLVMAQTWDNGATPAIPTVTYGGVSMTQVATILHGNSTDERGTMFRLVAPATGANNIVATVSPAQAEICLSAVSYTGVDQTTPLDTPTTKEGKSVTSTSITVTSETGDLVIDGVSWYNRTITEGAGQTERALNDNFSSADSTTMSEEAGAASVDMSWTFDTAGNPGHIAVNVNASSDSQTVTPAVAENLATAFSPTITPGAVTVTPGVAENLATVFSPTVTPGAVTVTPGVADQTAVAFGPTVGAVDALNAYPAVADQTAVAFSPTVTPGAVTVTPGVAQSLAQAFDPVLVATLLSYDVGRFYRNAAEQFILVTGLPRSAGTAFRSTDGWETCSGHFAVPAKGKSAAMGVARATWAANKATDSGTLATLVNTVLNDAGYTRPNGEPVS